MGRPAARKFLEEWRLDANLCLEDLTYSDRFPWGDYLLSLPAPSKSIVLGPGVTAFQIARISDVPWINGMALSRLGRVDYFVTRSDTSQVRLHPHKTDDANVVYVDRCGPTYFGHLARREPWPIGYWGRPVTECICRLCPDLPAERHGQPTAAVIATDAGLRSGLTDIMTNKEALSWLEQCLLVPNHASDLSDGVAFPWVRWIFNQQNILATIGEGVTKFSVACITFTSPKTASGVVFIMDRLHPAGPIALLPQRYQTYVSRIVTDDHGTHLVDGAMQKASELVYNKAVASGMH